MDSLSETDRDILANFTEDQLLNELQLRSFWGKCYEYHLIIRVREGE